MNNSKKQRGAGLILLLVFLLFGCDYQAEKKEYPFTVNDRTMGTSYSVKVTALPTELPVEELRKEIKTSLERINAKMSTYQQDSELSMFNASRSIEWQSVSDALFKVISSARNISELSHGAFDITVGPLVNLWGFGPDPMTFTAPAKELIEQKKAQTGYKLLEQRLEPLAIKKSIPDLYLDLSSIAKGYAVDQIGELLEAHGIKDYLVEIGGEIRLRGNNLNGSPWRIAIEKPTPEQRMIQKIVPITDVAMATSGDYRNFFEVDGVRFSHTIDPRTGRPITHKLASVTVLRETTMEADALATAFMVLGPQEALELAERNNIAALFIIKTERGFDEKSTSAFSEKIKVKP
ncbi:MAG: FAD:protein FMN transferase [Gammaproteobacteria bacterium]